MDPRLTECIQDLAAHVPFVVDIKVHIDAMQCVTLALTCDDGLSLHVAYDLTYLQRVPQKILREEILYRLAHERYNQMAARWQAMKATPSQGIAVVTFGAFSLQQSIAWPPPHDLRFSFALRCHIENMRAPEKSVVMQPLRMEHAQLIKAHALTRVAHYEVISQ